MFDQRKGTEFGGLEEKELSGQSFVSLDEVETLCSKKLYFLVKIYLKFKISF